LAVGIVIGGVATWVRQGRWRQAARAERANADRLRREAERLRERSRRCRRQRRFRGRRWRRRATATRPEPVRMRVVNAAEIDGLLDYPGLIEAIAAAFAGTVTFAPPRHHHRIPRAGGEATLLLMPAWQEGAGGFLGVKAVTVFPDNASRDSRASWAPTCCSPATAASRWPPSTAWR
jgi:hypothetical protein